MTIPLSRRALAPDFCHRRERAPENYGHFNCETGSAKEKGRGGACLSVFRYSGFVRSSFQETNKRRKRNAGKRWATTAASCDAARALLERARLTAFHRGSHLGEYFIPKVSFRPGFLGLGLNGRYPPSPVPVQGCTSHPGRNAGRHDAQAAREQPAKPPAGTALAPMTRCASAPRPSPERGLYSNCNRDICQEVVSEKDTSEFMILSPSCPLYPRKRTFDCNAISVAMGQKRPKCSAPKALLFDHFVGDGEQISRNRKPDGLCGFQFFFANSIRSAK